MEGRSWRGRHGFSNAIQALRQAKSHDRMLSMDLRLVSDQTIDKPPKTVI
jgi:hypothetical protein